MPTYTFRDINTDEIIEAFVKLSDYENFCSNNPNLERYFDAESTVGIIGGIGGIRNDSGWKEVLSKVAESHPNSELGKKTLSRTSKQVKVDNIVSKYKKKVL